VLHAGLDGQFDKEDRVAVEAPLEFQLHHPALGLEPVSFGATMRTPGDDEQLAAGLLYGEGILNHPSDVEVIEASTRRPNVVNIRLRSTVSLDTPTLTFPRARAAGCAARPDSTQP
jgi:FdhD protein